MKRLAILVLAFACAAWAASIDGKWSAELKARRGKKGAAPVAETVTLNLKAEGNQLTGSVVTPGKKRGRNLSIKDGKLEGDRFSFTTVQTGKKGETRMAWSGSLQGDELTGTRAREGGKGKNRGTPFVAKRQ